MRDRKGGAEGRSLVGEIVHSALPPMPLVAFSDMLDDRRVVRGPAGIATGPLGTETAIGARIEAGHTVGGLGSSREHQDGDAIPFGAQHPAHREAIDVGHHDVEYRHIGLRRLDETQRGCTVVGLHHVVPLEAERARQRFPNGPIVVGDENASAHFLAFRSRTIGRSSEEERSPDRS